MTKTRKAPVTTKKPGWELNYGLFEVHWKRGGTTGLYADKVRVTGTSFRWTGKLPPRKGRKGR